MNRNDFYLGIPPAYGRVLGALRWSQTDTAIEFADGRLFVFKDELGLFLAGFDLVRALIPFGYVLHLLRILGHGDDKTPDPDSAFSYLLERIRGHAGQHPGGALELVRLREAYRKAGTSIRNAGALCARLCADIPDEPGEISGREVCRRLVLFEAGNLPYVDREPQEFVEPPLSATEFEQKIQLALQKYSSADLERLLKAGTLPLTTEARKVGEVVRLPPTLKGIIAVLEQAPRMAASIPYISQMVSALSIPPRRWNQSELPLGGYADITSRGRPEQILPGQFALDSDEFTRRFAENELLYFRREEPPTNRRESLVLLLDQGVRTWGVVQSLLGAATLALMRQADRRRCSLQIAVTSKDGRLINPLEIDQTMLVEVVEATDLSLNPALALETVLLATGKEALDIVLLTHPRNLDEQDLATAAARANKNTRLFAVAADSEGRVEFAMLGRGRRRTITQIRIDLKAKQVPIPPLPTTQLGEAVPYVPWTGDVEPYGYPFWIGLIGTVEEIAFDHEGNWVFALSGERGNVYAARLNGKVKEILPLPRAEFHRQYPTLRIHGVQGGVCLVGGNPGNKQVAIAHYDCARRRVSLFRMEDAGWLPSEFYYDRVRHSIVTGDCSRLDLALGKIKDMREEHSEGARSAFQLHTRPTSSVGSGIPVHEPDGGSWTCPRTLELNHTIGELYLWSPVAADPISIRPLENGEPVLVDCTLRNAVVCKDTLLLEFFPNRFVGDYKLLVLYIPTGKVLGSVISQKMFRATLSRDGLSMAWRMSSGDRLLVADVMRGCEPILRLEKGRFHSQIRYVMRPGGLLVTIARINHLITWNAGILEKELLLKRRLSARFDAELRKEFNSEGKDGPVGDNKPLPGYRSRPRADRFVSIALSKLIALGDTLGHIWIFQPPNRLLCTFFFFRSSFAAWMPDGTTWGPPNLIGGPSTPGALEKIGSTLAKAEQAGRTQ